jgi:Tfp pilus assembly protein PilO
MKPLLREQVALLIMGALLLAIWILAVAPERERGQRLAKELATLETQTRAAERSVEVLGAIQREVREGQERLRRMQDRTLETKDLGRILAALSRETRMLGVQIVSMRPLAERAASGDVPTRQIPVELEIQGRFLDLGRYLEGLQSAPFLFTVEGVQLTRADKEKEGLRLAMRMVAVAHVRPQGPEP